MSQVEDDPGPANGHVRNRAELSRDLGSHVVGSRRFPWNVMGVFQGRRGGLSMTVKAHSCAGWCERSMGFPPLLPLAFAFCLIFPLSIFLLCSVSTSFSTAVCVGSNAHRLLLPPPKSSRVSSECVSRAPSPPFRPHHEKSTRQPTTSPRARARARTPARWETPGDGGVPPRRPRCPPPVARRSSAQAPHQEEGRPRRRARRIPRSSALGVVTRHPCGDSDLPPVLQCCLPLPE